MTWTDKRLLVRVLSALPFLGHYQRVHKVLLEVHETFKETDLLSELSNVFEKKRILYVPPRPGALLSD